MNPMYLSGLSSTKFLYNHRTKSTQQVSKLVEDLILFLNTAKGTLFGRPDYGTNLQEYLFEPTVSSTAEAIRNEIVSAIKRSYPDLKVDRVDIDFILNGISVKIYYSINMNGTIQLLTFDIMRERR